METELHALGQWEVIEGTVQAPTPATANQPTPDETRAINPWNLGAARAYAEIALRLEDDHSETIATTSDPVTAWTMLETSFGTQQAGIQSILDAELTLARWNGQTPINARRGCGSSGAPLAGRRLGWPHRPSHLKWWEV